MAAADAAGLEIMKQVFTKLWQRQHSWVMVSLFVIVFGGFGTYLLVESHATTPTAGIEGESGTASTPAGVVNDSTASGGKAIKFGPGNGSGNLVWDDEFNGSSVDTSKWTVWDTTLSYDAEYNTSRPQNVFEQNGILTERAIKESYGGRSYTSAYLNTIGKQNFGVGYAYEIRAKTPTQPNTSAGIWPAFWLRSNETTAEVDIGEWYGTPQPADPNNHSNKVTITVHSDTTGGSTDTKDGYDAVFDNFFPVGTTPWSAFHTYRCEVKTDGYYFYIDGVLVHSVLLKDKPWIAAGLGSTWNMRLNLQIGLAGKWAGAPDANTIFPADFQVDYVRIYKL